MSSEESAPCSCLEYIRELCKTQQMQSGVIKIKSARERPDAFVCWYYINERLEPVELLFSCSSTQPDTVVVEARLTVDLRRASQAAINTVLQRIRLLLQQARINDLITEHRSIDGIEYIFLGAYFPCDPDPRTLLRRFWGAVSRLVDFAVDHNEDLQDILTEFGLEASAFLVTLQRLKVIQSRTPGVP